VTIDGQDILGAGIWGVGMCGVGAAGVGVGGEDVFEIHSRLWSLRIVWKSARIKTAAPTNHKI
jgi:hypothetical protein